MQAAARGAIFSSKSSSARFPHSSRGEVYGSYIWRRGRSFAASFPSDSSKPQKASRRVPIHERRAMVESFVHKYRISNAGKFPTATAAQKQVGGSYYVIRQILQEIQYKFKLSNVNKKDEVQLKTTEEAVLPYFDPKEEPQESTAHKELSNSAITDISAPPSSRLIGMEESSTKIIEYPKMDETLISEHDEATSEYFEAKEESKVSTQEEEVLIEEASDHDTLVMPVRKSLMKGEETTSIKCEMSNTSLRIEVEGEDCNTRITADESIQDKTVVSTRDQVIDSTTTKTHGHQRKLESGEILQPPEEAQGSRKDRMAIKGSDGLKGETVLKNVQEDPESENFDRSSSEKLPAVEEPPTVRSTVWGNLKSLADGIINFWRKM
ncbi:hypothetical protein MRB53_033780 [Persea americana]|uniref:Uncharacterized protein n=1 Tax=Persea americana TaxID=3435 RepID=A0ACC2KW96_PERAE|nr:hypothetical protein MRB53_033780 [Persea americana]